jgi:hypothetical protein
MIDALAQVWLAVFGLAAIFFVARKSRLGPLLGLISQPAWLWTAVAHRQLGVLLIAGAYTVMWVVALVQWRALDAPAPRRYSVALAKHEAVSCLDCEAVYDVRHRACPRCAGGQFRILEPIGAAMRYDFKRDSRP